MPKFFKFSSSEKGFSHILLLLVLVIMAGLAVGISKQSSDTLSVPQNVLGENQEAKKLLTPCSSGGLTTSVHKRNQGSYTNEDFIRINDLDLLKDVSQLKNLTCLQYLDATDRTIKGDIADLKNLVNLEVFSLYSNPDVYGDICALAGASKLRAMKFAFDPKITGNISCLKGLTNLENFAMTHTQISGDISVFANMPKLKAIYINGTNLSGDICALKDLTNLQELGISNEYPGNKNIKGDLSCLDSLQKLTRAEIYSTSTTNCEQFTKSHPNIEQGGCSKESLKTLVDYGQKYEKKIDKVVQGGGSDYQKDAFSDFGRGPSDRRYEGSTDKGVGTESDKRNFFAKFIDWISNLFRGLPIIGSATSKMERPQAGPGGCRSQAECDTFCSKPENKESCSKFAPPEGINSQNGLEAPDLTKGGPGGCKSRTECQSYCSKLENSEECSKFFAPSGGGPQASGQQSKAKGSNLACRVSILPASKGTAPYEARVCVDNPDEVIQGKYIDYVDYDGNGSWDYQGRWDQKGSVHGCHGYTFQSKGIFSPKAKIIDQEGKESDICKTSVTVN